MPACSICLRELSDDEAGAYLGRGTCDECLAVLRRATPAELARAEMMSRPAWPSAEGYCYQCQRRVGLRNRRLGGYCEMCVGTGED